MTATMLKLIGLILMTADHIGAYLPGMPMKNLFYVYYPAHIYLLYLIAAFR